MSERILCVDDEPHVLEGFKRGLRRQFEIDTACSAAEGLEAVANRGPYAVIVSDMRMPGMDGVQFLATVKQRAPDSVRIMLTGQADQQTAIDAVNEGNIFRFLLKPCPADVLAKTLAAGVQQYRLVTAEKELLNKTLRGSIKLLTDVLALVSPAAFGRAARVRRLAQQLAAELNLEQRWHLEMAAMLSQIGLISLPPDTVEKLYLGKPLTDHEKRMFESYPGVGRDLLANIPRLEKVAEIIYYQEKHFDGGGIPVDVRKRQEIPLESRILKVALDFDMHCLAGQTTAQALVHMRQAANRYDPSILAALRTIAGAQTDYQPRDVRITELTDAMIIADDVRAVTGLLLVSRGQEASRSLRERLHNFARHVGVQEPIRVLVPTGPEPNTTSPAAAAAGAPRRNLS